MGLVKTRFVQPVGAFSGVVTAGGKVHRVNRILGVVENQDATW
ncbi:MAG: hypothetical protein IPK82_28315 [Polyangiaceae bacterium]|nr:hypothetical protein [Polyangiaceae bacterium]